MMKSLPIPRLSAGNPYFDAIVPRAARLTCVREEFADLWRAVMGREWQAPHPPTPSPTRGEGEKGVVGAVSGDGPPALDPDTRQRLRDEIDALVAHLYGLSRDEFDHILGTFPLVFPDDAAGREKRARLLAVYDEVAGWL